MSNIEFVNPLDNEAIEDINQKPNPVTVQKKKSIAVSAIGALSPKSPSRNKKTLDPKSPSMTKTSSLFSFSRSSSLSSPRSPTRSQSTGSLTSSTSESVNSPRSSSHRRTKLQQLAKHLEMTPTERENLVKIYGAQVGKVEKEVKEIFYSDANDEGQLELAGFCKVLGFLGLRNQRLSSLFFTVIDANKSSTIEFIELINFLLLIRCGTEEDKLSFGFRLLDRDMDNVLSYEDLSLSIQDLYSVVLCDDKADTAQEVANFVDTVFEEMATLPQAPKTTDSTSKVEDNEALSIETRFSRGSKQNTLSNRMTPKRGMRYSVLYNNDKPQLTCNIPDDVKRITWQSFRTKARGMEIYLRTLGAQSSTLDKPKLRTDLNNNNSFGGPRYRFILTMMLGIESAIRRINLIENTNDDLVDDDDDDFDPSDDTRSSGIGDLDNTKSVTKEVFQIPTSDGSSFRVTSYGADDFRAIREGFGLTDDEFLISVGIRQVVGSLIMGDMFSLNEQISEGKSGSLFFWTKDGQYMIKTISKSESHVMRKTLRSYRAHLAKHPNSLLMKILGLYRLKTQGEKYEIIIMQNVFETNVQIDERFDIKGSSYLRTVGEKNRCKPGLVMKDSDFVEMGRWLEVGKLGKQLEDIIKADASYLASNSIIDYSFLVGVHHRNKQVIEEDWKKENSKQLEKVYQDFLEVKGSFFEKSMDFDTFAHYAFLHESNVVLNKSSKSTNNENFVGLDGELLYNWRKGYAVPSQGDGEDEVILFFGIIDTLVPFDHKKYSEYMIKSVIQRGKNFSVIPPQKYANRFVNFLVNLIK